MKVGDRVRWYIESPAGPGWWHGHKEGTLVAKHLWHCCIQADQDPGTEYLQPYHTLPEDRLTVVEPDA